MCPRFCRLLVFLLGRVALLSLRLSPAPPRRALPGRGRLGRVGLSVLAALLVTLLTAPAAQGRVPSQVVFPPVISKSFGAATIPVNGTTSLVFAITNLNSSLPLTGVGFTDTLPAGLVVATPSGLSGACLGGTITAVAGTTSISLTGAIIVPSGACVFSVNVTGTSGGVHNNATSAVTSTQGGAGNSATASITVVAPPVISKSFGAASILLNGFTSLTFSISNPNPATTLTEVGFTDSLPAGLVLTRDLPETDCNAPISFGGTFVSVSGATLSPAGSCSVTLFVTGTSGAVQNNVTSAVTSNEGGTGNAATASITVVAPPTISQTFSPATILRNGSTSLSFTVTNPNAGTVLTGVRFDDFLNIGMVNPTTTGSCGGGTITIPVSNGISLTGATLAGGASCTFSVNFTITQAGDWLSLSENVTSTNGGTGNSSTATLTVVEPTSTPTPTLTPTNTPPVIFTPTPAAVTATPTPPPGGCILGDINCDGIVDIRDYGIWRQNFGQTNCGNPADLNGDCIVDIRDYGIWRANFGHTAGAARRGETAPAPRGTPGPILLESEQAAPGSWAPPEPNSSGPAVPVVPLVGGLLGLSGLAG
jgi:hypothetical protein